MFKTSYTKQESEELLKFIDSEPTGEMHVADGIDIKDVALFCKQMRAIVKERYANPAFAGQIELLAKLKEAYEAR